MGYSADMYIMKRSVIEREKKYFPEASFEELWNNHLFAWVYPEDYEIPDDEVGRSICWTYHRVFFKEIKILGGRYDDVQIVERELYDNICADICYILKNTRLIDLVEPDCDDHDALIALIDIYRSLKSAEINWDKEVVVYSCG